MSVRVLAVIMAGTPAEQPVRFVCMNCYTIVAGIPGGGGPDPENYEPPAACGACSEDDFVDLTRFVRTYEQRR